MNGFIALIAFNHAYHCYLIITNKLLHYKLIFIDIVNERLWKNIMWRHAWNRKRNRKKYYVWLLRKYFYIIVKILQNVRLVLISRKNYAMHQSEMFCSSKIFVYFSIKLWIVNTTVHTASRSLLKTDISNISYRRD